MNHHLPNCINDDDNQALLAPVSMMEVYKAVHEINPLKSPGPNGIHAKFYQAYWPQVKDHFFDLVMGLDRLTFFF